MKIKTSELIGHLSSATTDEIAQIVNAVNNHQALVQMVGRLTEYLSVAGDDGSYDAEIAEAMALVASVKWETEHENQDQ